MAISPRALAALVALTLLPLAGFLLVGGKDADAQGTPVVASPNVTKVGPGVPGTAAISGVFSRSAPFFYVSGLDSLSVLDVSDPKSPKLVGKLVNAIFQNEAMTLGERVGPDGKVQRFVLVGNDLAQVSVTSGGVQRGRVGGQQLIVVDVTNPAAPKIVGLTPSTGPGTITTSTHTVACMNPSCSIAYSAGGAEDNNKFSIIDLTDITKPREVKSVESPAIFPNAVFTFPSGHHWNVDGQGLAWQAGAGGTAVFDIADPLNPTLVNGTDANGRKTPYNDFIHHNTQRPNARAFAPGKPLGVQNGNVVLVGEEDYANDGDEVDCKKAGTFQTWEVPDLDAAANRQRNPKGEPDKGTVRVLDTINPPTEGGGLTTPAGAFCSVHWFDFHPSGIVAIGNYQQGLRLVDTRDPRDLKQYGYFTGGATEVWDAYWAPQRDDKGAIVPGRKTNLVYTVDAVQGVGVFEVSGMPADLPISGDDTRGTFPSKPGNVAEDNAKLGSGGGSSQGDARSGQSGPRYTCVSRRQITITVPKVGKSRLRSVRVTVNGKRHRGQLRGRKSVRVSLARKLKGRYTVKVTGVTRSGKRVSTTRYYRTCTPKGTPLPSGAKTSKIQG